MMEIKGNMMSVREDVRVLDATLRDGGLVNDFYFTDDFVYDLYKANLAAGVDYMEFGYRAENGNSRRMRISVQSLGTMIRI